MNILSVATLCALAVLAAADFREKRQVDYQFPAPRGREAQPQDDSALYQVPRRQFQAQPVQPYAPPPPPPQQRAPAQSYAPPQQTRRAPQPSRTQYAAEQPRGRRPADEEEEEEKGPDPLALLLQGSKFACSDKKDGYYADNSVGCQAFHYCVGGARHSWMCPENTVFHQVHLNCVPASQDICGQTEKYHFVNDYLHKTLDQRGPNNTVLYAQRYYPEGYSVGDDFSAPNSPPRDEDRYHEAPRYAPQPQAQPAYRQPAPAPQPQQQPAYRQPAPAPQARPYNPPQQARPTYSQPAPQAAPPQFASYGQAAPQGRPLPAGTPVQQAPRRAPQHSQGSRAAAVSPYSGYPPQGGVRYDDDQY